MLVIDGLSEEGILGNDFLESHKSEIDYEGKKMTLTFGGIELEVPFERREKENRYQRNVYTNNMRSQAIH